MTIYRNPVIDFAAKLGGYIIKKVSGNFIDPTKDIISVFIIPDYTFHIVLSTVFYFLFDMSFTAFPLDIGAHTSGWWKNPDYEACWHLSISYAEERGNKHGASIL
jgi:hypothetical protein